eukprot:1494541-Prymnesium_polylepis.1
MTPVQMLDRVMQQQDQLCREHFSLATQVESIHESVQILLQLHGHPLGSAKSCGAPPQRATPTSPEPKRPHAQSSALCRRQSHLEGSKEGHVRV